MTSSISLADDWVKFMTCTVPPSIEDGYTVYNHRTDINKAQVRFADQCYDVNVVNEVWGSTYDFKTKLGIERLIIAHDGLNEYYIKSSQRQGFRKIADLNCLSIVH